MNLRSRLQIRSPRVEVRRSRRRTRTVTAFRERDTIVVLIPQRMSKADEQTFVRDMVEKVLAREARSSAPRGDDALASRARDLAATYLAPALDKVPQPTAVFVGDEPAAALGLMHTEYRPHQAVSPPAAHAGVGR